jgi:uncharacterized protein YdaU (DUF1376 family)
MNYYTFHIGDFRGGTAHLSMEEECTYRRLLDLQYDQENPLLDDIAQLSRKVRSTPELVMIILNEFFTKTELGWVNAKAMNVITKHQEFSLKQKENGQKGGRRKPTQTQIEPNANPKEPKAKPPITQYPLPNTLINSNEFITALQEWHDYRKHIRKPLNPRQYPSIIKQFEDWGPEGSIASIRASIVNGYQGLFEPKLPNGSKPSQGSKPSVPDAISNLF